MGRATGRGGLKPKPNWFLAFIEHLKTKIVACLNVISQRLLARSYTPLVLCVNAYSRVQPQMALITTVQIATYTRG